MEASEIKPRMQKAVIVEWIDIYDGGGRGTDTYDLMCADGFNFELDCSLEDARECCGQGSIIVVEATEQFVNNSPNEWWRIWKLVK